MTTTLLLLSSSSWKKEDEVKEKDEHESEEVVEGEEEEGEEEQEETTPPPPPTITRVDPMTVIGHPHPFLHTEEDYAGCLYFDYNATTPIYAEVYQAMLPYLTTTFGNPSSSHIYGRRCAEAVKEAREQVAKMINATHPHEEILFTSCGTESDNDAIKIAIHHYYHHHHHHQQQQQHDKKEIPIPHIITSTIEHPAIINYLRVMELRNELRYSLIPVNEEGYVDIQVACSAGSACHSQPSQSTNTTTTAEGDDELSLEEEKKQKKVVYVMSDVLKAMNAKEIYALGTLRLSFGRHTSVKDVEEAARRIHEVVTSTLSSRG
eukprot:scaffold1190_cov187-Ochromonas_danica.AAC.7